MTKGGLDAAPIVGNHAVLDVALTGEPIPLDPYGNTAVVGEHDIEDRREGVGTDQDACAVALNPTAADERGDPGGAAERRHMNAVVEVIAPKPPGSSTSISPPAAVFEIAPANVLHGSVREHGLASSPTPDTQVRIAMSPPASEPDMWRLPHDSSTEEVEMQRSDRAESGNRTLSRR